MEVEDNVVNTNCSVCLHKLIKEILFDKFETYKCTECKTLIIAPGCYRDLISKWVILIGCSGDYFFNFKDYIIDDSFEKCGEKFKRLWKLRGMW